MKGKTSETSTTSTTARCNGSAKSIPARRFRGYINAEHKCTTNIELCFAERSIGLGFA